jgi:hypothetical protein
VAQTSVQKKRKDYTICLKLNWTLIACRFSGKLMRRARADMIKKFAFEYKIGRGGDQ